MASAAIFEQLQLKLDEDSQIREDIRNVVQTLERQARSAESILTRVHSIPQANIGPTLMEAWEAIDAQRKTLVQLNQLASQHPYYKYNQMWSRRMESLSFHLVFYGFLEALDEPQGMLYTIEEVSNILAVPFNLKDQDAFHLTIEEYLLSLILLIDELTRLAINSVTLGDYQVPLRISQFVKDLHAGFQVLNLKNDILRKRSDSIKYSVSVPLPGRNDKPTTDADLAVSKVKKIEEVVYDLSLRKLIP